MTPHKATPGAWKNVRDWAKNEGAMYAVPSVLIEIADRVAALEEASSELTGTIASADSDIERRLTALESQHNLMVDSITDLQGCVNQLEAAATQPPATAADHSRGATEMVATDEELIETFYIGARGALAAPGFRAVYNLGRQYSAQSRQEREVVPVLWVRRKPGPGCNASVIAWLPGVGDLPIGEHILYAFPGTSQPRQEEEATPPPAPAGDPVAVPSGLVERVLSQLPSGTDPVFARQAILETADWADENGYIATARVLQEVAIRPITHPTPPPAPTGGLLERVVGVICKTCDLELEARAAIHAVADWLQQRSSTIANGSQWAEMLRREADR
jgi:hypothetical protein